MKRTQLKRKTPLKKISEKRQAMLDREQEDRNDWIAEQGNFCWHCGYVPDTYGMGDTQPIDTHEMVRLSEHADAWQRANYSRLCRACHKHFHGAGTIEELLALKMIYDYQNYSLGPIAKMRTKAIVWEEIERHYQRFINEKGRRT